MDKSADKSKAITSWFLRSQRGTNKESLPHAIPPSACPATGGASGRPAQDAHFTRIPKTMGHLWEGQTLQDTWATLRKSGPSLQIT